MVRIRLHQVTKHFGVTPALSSVSLEVNDGELFFLLGPSGCGKTTLLRLLAGFYQPDSGEVYFGERRMNGVEPHRRNTGMVFQNYALWPHLTVEQNVAYGLEARGLPAPERREKVAEALQTVRMEDYATRSPNQLSGGQQQRVALARALVVRPDVLLLDEPLSNLDARLRLEMRDEIQRIHEETRLTTVYVTHDQKEALSMADRMAVMRAGVVEQIGAPREVYHRPDNRFVADFIGEANWLEGTVAQVSVDGVALDTLAGRLHALPRQGVSDSLAVGARVEVGFRPEAVGFGGAEVNVNVNRIEVVVRKRTYLGEVEQYVLELAGGGRFKAWEPNPGALRALGAPLTVSIPPGQVMVYPRRK